MEAIKESASEETQVIYEKEPSKQTLEREDISLAIIAVGEVPYAESYGDDPKLELPSDITNMVISVADKFPTLMILISGRPMVLDPELLEKIEALIAAWLPGTEGGGIGDLVFGDYEFEGRLPMTWLSSIELSRRDALFPIGFGLNKWSKSKSKSTKRNQEKIYPAELFETTNVGLSFKKLKNEAVTV